MANIVLATSLLWPEPASDAPLRDALIDRGHLMQSVPWNAEGQTAFLQADMVLLRSCWDYFEAPEKFLAWLDELESKNVPVRNRVPLVRWNFDKSYLLELKAAGFNVPETLLVDPRDHASIKEAMEQHGWQQAILKPVSGQSGKFVELLELSQSESWPISEMPTQQALLQDLQADVKERGETLLFFFNGKFSYAVQRLPKPVDGRSRIQVEVSDSIVSQAEKILNHLEEVPLYARIDGLIRGETFLLMELELIEPSFALETAPDKATEFVKVVEQALI